MKLNIITGGRAERMKPMRDELKRQRIFDFEFWDGVYLPSVKESINAAHKQIVEYAKLAQWPEVCIAEDDFVGSHEDSWRFYLSQKPRNFDLYLSMVYLGELDGENKVKEFTGMTLYTVSEAFYDRFLEADPKEHIDRALAGLGDYVVCNPFSFKQRNGWSSNTGKAENYDYLLRNRKFFDG